MYSCSKMKIYMNKYIAQQLNLKIDFYYKDTGNVQKQKNKQLKILIYTGIPTNWDNPNCHNHNWNKLIVLNQHTKSLIGALSKNFKIETFNQIYVFLVYLG